MNNFTSYYLNELNALHHLGKEFAEEHPALTQYLDSKSGDPDIERLFEGFAFLSGRLHQRLDDELPELTHTLMRLLWPTYTRIVPSFSTVKFSPKEGFQKKYIVKKNTEVLSKSIDELQCQFNTVYDVSVFPLSIHNSYFESVGKTASYRIRMKLEHGTKANELDCDKLRFHFHGEERSLLQLQLMILEFCDNVTCEVLDEEEKHISSFTIDSKHIQSVGFSENEQLLNYSSNIPNGFRYLQDYFCYPEKFNYIDVFGLEGLSHDRNQDGIYIDLTFNMKQVVQQAFFAERVNVELFCAPVINEFETNTAPITVAQRQDSYHLQPQHTTKDQGVVTHVQNIEAWESSGSIDISIPLKDYLFLAQYDTAENLYSLSQKLNAATGFIDNMISFPKLSDKHKQIIVVGTVMACNGNFPNQLNVGDISDSKTLSDNNIAVSNLSKPTNCYNPPIEGNGLWNFISNASLNYLILEDLSSWKDIVESLDFPGYRYPQLHKKTERMLDGLKELSSEQTNIIHNGYPLRGFKTHLQIDSKNFSCEGELYLFASVLNQLVRQFTNINSFNQLIVTSSQGGNYTWPIHLS